MEKFIFYSTGVSLHNKIFLDNFNLEKDFDYVFLSSGVNPFNYPSEDDLKYSKSALQYAIIHPLQTLIFLLKAGKKGIRLNGIYRRVETIKRLASENNVSFIYSQQLIDASVICYLAKIPYVVSIWGSDFNIYRYQKWIKTLSRKTLEGAVLIHASSSRQKEILIKEGIEPNKIFVQHLGVDVKFFLPKETKLEIKKKFGFEGRKIICYPRGHNETYQPFKLLKLVSLIREKIPNLLLIVIGDSKYLPGLKAYVKENQFESNVLFTGFLTHEKIRTYMQMSDIFLQTPGDDGVSVAVMESLSSGTPVVSTDVFDTYVNVKDGLTGMLMDPEKLFDYVPKIVNLLNDESKLSELSKNCIEWAKENCEREEAIKNIIDHLRKVKV